ncbi:MAG: hypothetical protein H7X88_08985, partial [Gloeobacteraceae cyanobacterium ES-bin-316]|nr:hypothetical protein [Ferruginibacter sp.]
MNKLLSKFLFAQKITAGLPSLARLLWNSKLLRWSKTGFVKAGSASLPVCFRMRYQLGRRNLFLRT